jgi:hypothetical protein
VRHDASPGCPLPGGQVGTDRGPGQQSLLTPQPLRAGLGLWKTLSGSSEPRAEPEGLLVARAAERSQVAQIVGATASLGLDVVDLEPLGRAAPGAAPTVTFEHGLARPLGESAIGVLGATERNPAAVRGASALAGLAQVEGSAGETGST